MTFAPANPKREAQGLLPRGLVAHVLEPSPPACNDGEYKADDPASPDDQEPGLLHVTPTTAGDVTWDEMTRRLPHLSDFATEHWLGAWQPLGSLPDSYVPTVSSLGQLAFYVMAPARYEEHGKVGLRFTFRGFGTPFYGGDRQVRVEGEHLVVQDGDTARGQRITTVRDAAQLAGIEYNRLWGPAWHDPPAAADPDRPLTVEGAATLACSEILGFGFSILEQLRVEAREEEKPTRVQLWPEHFDASVEIGVEELHRRAGFGVSPGYAAHTEPYLYVSPWSKHGLDDPYWNADFFGGSILRYSDLIQAEDQRKTALDFLRTGLEILRAR